MARKPNVEQNSIAALHIRSEFANISQSISAGSDWIPLQLTTNWTRRIFCHQVLSGSILKVRYSRTGASSRDRRVRLQWLPFKIGLRAKTLELGIKLESLLLS